MNRREWNETDESCVLAAALVALIAPAAAQDWPNRPITLVVPFAAGGGVDASARMQAIALGEILGQTVVVENVGAAAGTVGSARVAKAAPDGYTMLIGNRHPRLQPVAVQEGAVRLAQRTSSIWIVTESPRLLVARKDLPANNLKEFVAYMKANKAKIQYARPASAPAPICRARCSISPPASISRTCPIAAKALPCRT